MSSSFIHEGEFGFVRGKMLDFTSFDTFLHNIVISELWKTGLDETTAECKTGWKTVLTEY